jgi:hypothetical protein
LVAPAAALDGRQRPDPDHGTQPLAPWPGEQDWLDAVDEEVIGFRRGTQHRFKQATRGVRALRADRAGRPARDMYISAEGHIGPLLAAPGADEATVALDGVRAALEGQPKQVSLIVPGRADRILAALSPLGFRIEESMLMMASRSFGDWTRYQPSNPGFM